MRPRSKSKNINTCTRPTCTGPPHGVRHTRAPHVKQEHPGVHVRRHEAVTIGTAGAQKTGMAAYKMTHHPNLELRTPCALVKHME